VQHRNRAAFASRDHHPPEDNVMAQNLKATLPAQTAGGADAVTVLGAASEVGGTDGQVVSAAVIAPPGVTITGQATNNATISVRQMRGGVAIATVATLTTANGVSILPEQPTAMAITPAMLQKGDVLDVLMHQNAAGQAIAAGLIVDVASHFQAR
jgi:hypothetical protein